MAIVLTRWISTPIAGTNDPCGMALSPPVVGEKQTAKPGLVQIREGLAKCFAFAAHMIQDAFLSDPERVQAVIQGRHLSQMFRIGRSLRNANTDVREHARRISLCVSTSLSRRRNALSRPGTYRKREDFEIPGIEIPDRRFIHMGNMKTFARACRHQTPPCQNMQCIADRGDAAEQICCQPRGIKSLTRRKTEFQDTSPERIINAF